MTSEPVMGGEPLQEAWERYKAKSLTPELLNYADFSAGFGSAQGGLEQFLRMKSRLTEVEEQLVRFQQLLRSYSAPGIDPHTESA
jgi:hypothetical protein